MPSHESLDPGSARVRFWADGAAYACPRIQSQSHAHHAVQLTLPLQALEAASWVGADVSHGCQHEGPVILVFLDPECAVGRALNHVASRTDVTPFDATPLAAPVQALADSLDASVEPGGDDPGRRAVCAIVAHLTRDAPAPPPLDRRVRAALEILRAEPGQMPPLPALAAQVSLSPSRLKTLFRLETGLSVSAYVLWLRQVQALYLGLSTTNLTHLAHESGFADAAHMSRTHRRMFDWTPSEFWRSCRPNVQGLEPPSVPPLD